MKKNNIILKVAICIAFLACIIVLLVNVLGLSIIKHYNTQIGELSIKYYGDFSTVKVIKIYDGAIRRGTFALNVDKDILSNSNEYSPYLDDLNEDGHKDIVIPHSMDENNALRYAVFLWKNEINMFEVCVPMSDIANLTKGEENNYFSSISLHNIIFEEQSNVPEVYESHKIFKEYRLFNGRISLVRNYTLIYYSDTDAYCYVKIDYDADSGEIVSSVEDWLDEDEASQIDFYK